MLVPSVNVKSIISQQARPTLDDIDFELETLTFVLANRFTIQQLRREVHTTEKHIFLSEYFEGTSYKNWLCDIAWWQTYKSVCQEALVWQTNNPHNVKPATPGKRINAEAIKAHSDIVSVIEGYTTLRKSGKRYSGLCPLHADKKSASLFVYPEDNSFHCFGCHAHGDVFDFIQQMERTDFRGAAAILGGV